MSRRQLILINAGPNGDGPEELYTDAIEILRKTGRKCSQHPDEFTPEDIARDIAAAVAILDGELRKTAE